jgi:hypothetical protein
MSQYWELKYFYPNKIGKILRPDQLYRGETILYKNENIKFEDENKNIHRGTNTYFTNFRILSLSDEYIFDIPYLFIEKMEIKKPFVLNLHGSQYINLTLPKICNLAFNCPLYLSENFEKNQILSTQITYPRNVEIKFKKDSGDINQAFNHLQKAYNNKDYMNSYLPKVENQEENIQTNYNPQIRSYGLGMERVKKQQEEKIKQDSLLINSSFTGIQSLRQNAEQMISLAQQIRAKLGNSNQNKESSEINGILSKIGFIDPVTKEVSGSDYYINLGEQINDYFYKYFTENPNIKVITLIDAYCIYNRARGGNTISPKDMTQALKYFENNNHQVLVKNFNNEMIVLHTKEYSSDNILVLITNFMKKNGQNYIDMNDMSKILNVENVLLEKILIEDLLFNGKLLIDEDDLEVRYYLNNILSYNI